MCYHGVGQLCVVGLSVVSGGGERQWTRCFLRKLGPDLGGAVLTLAGLLTACALSSDGVRWAVGPRGRLSGSKSASAEGETGRQGPGGAHLGSSERARCGKLFGDGNQRTRSLLAQLCKARFEKLCEKKKGRCHRDDQGTRNSAATASAAAPSAPAAPRRVLSRDLSRTT